MIVLVGRRVEHRANLMLEYHDTHASILTAHADGWCLAFNGPGGKENLVPRVAPSDPPVWGA